MTGFSLDATDCRILSVLQEDGRISNLDLAERISLSPSACLRRMRLLEEEGVIASVSTVSGSAWSWRRLSTCRCATIRKTGTRNLRTRYGNGRKWWARLL